MLTAAKYIGVGLATIYNNINKNNLAFIVMLIYSILLLLDVTVHCYYSIELLPDGDSGKYILYMDGNNPGNTNTSGATQDPVRWWPSGVPQAWATIGAFILSYRGLGNSLPARAKFITAIGMAGATTSLILVNSALENSVGFNRFVVGWTEYNRTGIWPSVDNVTVSDAQTESIIKKAIDAYKKEQGPGSGPGSASGSGPSLNSLTSDENPVLDSMDSFFQSMPDTLLQALANIFRAESVAGHLDDLMGQQLFILICLFFLMIFIILLFVSYTINNIFLHYKDVLLNYFDNKYLRLYFNYQVILSRLFILYMPIIIIISMVGLCKGILFLITHTIPYEFLDIDLHTFIKRD